MTQEKLTADGEEKGYLLTQPADLTTAQTVCGGLEKAVIH